MASPEPAKSIRRLAMPVALRWGLGLVSVLLAFVVAQAFVFYHLPQPFTAFALSAIAGAFWYGGTKPGIFTALILWLVRDYFFEPDVGAESRLLYGLVFLVFALVMTLAMRGRNELEAGVAERAELTKTNEDLTLEIARHKGAEAELRAVIDNAPVFLWSDLPDGYCDFLNQHFLTYFNLSLQEAHGAGWATLLHPDDAAHHLESWQKSVATGSPLETEARFRRPDGKYRWFLTRASPLRDKTGRIVKWYGTNIDIENLKRTERRLRQSEAYLAEAQRLSRTGTWAFNKTKTLYWSEEGYRLWGLDPLQGLPARETIWQRIHPDDRDRVYEGAQEAIRQKRDYAVEFRIVVSDGTVKYIESCCRHLFSEDGELVEVVGTHIDVTERKRAEEALRESEAKIRRLVDANIIGIFIWDFEGRIIEANDAFLRMVDYDREDLVSGRIRWTELTPPEWLDRDERRWLPELKVTGSLQPFEKEYFRKDGSRVPVLIGAATFEEGGNQGVAFVLDLTERKCAEEALRESEGKFRDYAETASDWFWEIGPDYKFTLLTENAYGSGAADRIGTACWDHALDLETEPEKWRLVRATLDSRQPFRDFVYCSKGNNGSPIYVKASGKPVFGASGEFRGYRGTATDVTASMRAQEEHERLRELESHLAHMNRVSVMGELAASLVHEITQPIATARNNARAATHFLDRNPPDLGEVREALACLVGDTDRAGKIVDGVRDHIKKAPLRKDRFDLNDAIKEVIELARTAIVKNGVVVHTRLMERGPLVVEGDRVQLQQVALNLILNAAEAMSSVNRGARDLLISTEQSQPDEVLVAVRDSGPGINPKDLERVFETFYTTKSRGIGMGLSISRSIVAAHGGRLWAEVNAPRGAVFRFTLRGAAKDSRILLGRPAGPKRCMKALQQTRIVNGLSKPADDPIVEHAVPVDIGREENRRNRVSGIDEMSVEVDSGHSRHLDVGDQAGGLSHPMGCEEIGGRPESLNGVAQRPHEPSHGLAKELIIIDDRHQ